LKVLWYRYRCVSTRISLEDLSAVEVKKRLLEEWCQERPRSGQTRPYICSESFCIKVMACMGCHGHGFSDVRSLRWGTSVLEHGTRSQSRMGNSFGHYATTGLRGCPGSPGSQASKPHFFPLFLSGESWRMTAPASLRNSCGFQLFPAAFFDSLASHTAPHEGCAREVRQFLKLSYTLCERPSHPLELTSGPQFPLPDHTALKFPSTSFKHSCFP